VAQYIIDARAWYWAAAHQLRNSHRLLCIVMCGLFIYKVACLVDLHELIENCPDFIHYISH
jgi:hypothetical protein